jgi:hypothetical protein
MKRYPSVEVKTASRSVLRLPSGVILHVHGSPEDVKWYALKKDYFNELTTTNPRYYYVIIVDQPEQSLVLPLAKVKEIFDPVDPGEDQEWHYSMVRDSDHYVIEPNNDPREIGDIHRLDVYLNNWKQVQDYASLTSDTSAAVMATARKSAKIPFEELHRFIVRKMDSSQANYQPIMIRTLLETGGRASRDQIARAIEHGNNSTPKSGFKQIPVYETLERHGVVYQEGNDFLLNVEPLTEVERQELILLCNWKNTSIPLQLELLINAFNHNRRLFNSRRTMRQEIEQKRADFVADFPIQKIRDMELDQYVIGKKDTAGNVNRETFCYRLERGIPEYAGLEGSTAFKFGVFVGKESQEYRFRPKFESAEQAFAAVKADISRVLQAGRQFLIDHDRNKIQDSIRCSSRARTV